jgi:hypothetical protein
METEASAQVSPAEFLWAAGELANLLKSATKRDVTVHDRLRLMIHSNRGLARALIEDKFPIVVASTGMGAATSNDLVTTADLKRVGLTLQKITQQDATLTGKALVLAGVISTFAHLQDLGVMQFTDLLQHVGQPRDLAAWLQKATGSSQAWQGNFLPAIKFDFKAWRTMRALLRPADLCVLNFWLGAHLESKPEFYLPLVATDTESWLIKAPKIEWVSTNQLTESQYARLLLHDRGERKF